MSKATSTQSSTKNPASLPAKFYAGLSVFILLASTIVWAMAGAHIQQNNADQLVSPYLFEDEKTFSEAQFPGQHTFLLKWPIFWALKAFGFSSEAFIVATVAVTAFTVLLFAWLLYRIVRRPALFGTLCLGLASVLLLVPAQPYPGGILPVNMAMLTTRNLEYLVFIIGLWLLARSSGLSSWRFWLGTGLLGLLVASDKLFLVLGLGGAVLLTGVYLCLRRWQMVRLGALWALGMVVAAGLASAALWGINHFGFTHVVSDTTVNPYGFVGSLKEVLHAIFYAGLGLLTNFGANPISDYRVLTTIPTQLREYLFNASALSFAVNLVILLSATIAAAWAVAKSLARKEEKPEGQQPDAPVHLVLMLVACSIVAVGIFIFTKHYYPVDARYLAITLFAGFMAMAVFLARRGAPWPHAANWLVDSLLLISVALGTAHAISTYHNEQQAMASFERRNRIVAHILSQRSTDVVVGDYWRVMPIKEASTDKLAAVPLSGCTQPSTILTSKAWQPDLAKTGFAYLLQLDANLTGSPTCSVQQIIDAYGHPNATVVIEGRPDKPQELLLFYDKGAKASAPTQAAQAPVQQSQPVTRPTVDPLTPDQIPYTSCPASTVMHVVAHEDDDLLFMNPDLLTAIKQGKCIRTVYMTAGDAGTGQEAYWEGRQEGSKAAYALMLDSSDIWIDHTIKLDDKRFVTISSPRDNPNVSLVFMHLPDGNLSGQGFAATDHESIARVEQGKQDVIRSVDGQSEYTASQLVDTLGTLMKIYQPAELRTQSSHLGSEYRDHSDHHTVSLLTKAAHTQYQTQTGKQLPITFYLSYPGRAMPENVSGDELAEKLRIFLAYGAHDPAVCQTQAACQADATYNGYLRRQYHADH